MVLFTPKLNKLLKEPRENQLGVLLSSTLNTLAAHPVILYPLCLYALIQLLTLEVLYFSARFPLSHFFAPLIKRLWSETFLHYPFNLVLLPKLFYYAQLPLYLFVGGFLSAIAIVMIAMVNEDKRVNFRTAARQASSRYIDIVLIALLNFLAILLISKFYQFGIYALDFLERGTPIMKAAHKTLLRSQPYIHLLMGTIVTTILAFCLPIIMIERKKFLPAIIQNFKFLSKSASFIFWIIFIPSLFYIPVLLFRARTTNVLELAIPELQVFTIILSIVATMMIDGFILTAVTMHYLHKQEIR